MEENGESPRPEYIYVAGKRARAIEKPTYLGNLFVSTARQSAWEDDEKGNFDLNTHIDASKDTKMASVLLELTRTFMDSCATSRGHHVGGVPTYKGLKLCIEDVKEDGGRGVAAVVWSDDIRYGEIVKQLHHHRPESLPFSEKRAVKSCPKVHYGSLRFTHYGEILPSMDCLSHYGVTYNRGRRNQASRFGERFCRTVTKLLSCGAGIQFRGLVYGVHGAMHQRWTFYTNKEKVGYKVDQPRKSEPNFPPKISIIITWKVDAGPTELINYDIHDFLAPIPALRNPLSPTEPGIILQDEAYRGRVFTDHVFVTYFQPNLFRWGYNFFYAKLSRDRDTINIEELKRHVAKCLSYLVVHDRRFSDTYFDLLLEQDDKSNLLEVRIDVVDMLTVEARQALAAIYTSRYPNTIPLSPLVQAARFLLSHYQIVPIHLVRAICIHNRDPDDAPLVLPLDKVIAQARNEVRTNPSTPILHAWTGIPELFCETIDIILSSIDNDAVRFMFSVDKKRLCVDTDKFPTNRAGILNDLICYVLPCVFEGSTCDLTNVFKKLEQSPEPTRKRSVEDDTSSPTLSEDEGDEGPSDPKRARIEEEEEEEQTDEDKKLNEAMDVFLRAVGQRKDLKDQLANALIAVESYETELNRAHAIEASLKEDITRLQTENADANKGLEDIGNLIIRIRQKDTADGKSPLP